jgi:hypothetical protein
MNTLLKSALLIIFGMSILSSCTTNTEPSNSATLLPLSEITNNVGYQWFDAEKSVYIPDDSKVRDIRTHFQNKNQKIYFFVNPSCSCDGTKKTFPRAIRILKDAGIPDDRIVIYSMRSHTDDHPLKDKFTLRGLPSIYITVNDNVKCKMEVIDGKLYVSGNGKSDDSPSSKLEEVIADGFSW